MSAAVAGLRSPLYVERRGAGSVLVMLHGGGGGIDDLAALRDRLLPGRQIISPDQRGHGRSAGDGAISYAAQAADTMALLDELAIGPADVLGWSDGGIVALLIARDRPDLVRRAVAISANASLVALPPAYDKESIAWFATADSSELSIPAGRDRLLNGVADWPVTATKILAMWRDGPDLDLDTLARISLPVLYLAADGDAIQPEHTVAMYRATPGAQTAIVPNATHRLVQTHVEVVAAIVERFLTG